MPVAALRQPNAHCVAGSGGDRRADVPAEGFGFRTWLDADADGANTLQYPDGAAVPYEQPFFDEERQFEQAVTLGDLSDVGEIARRMVRKEFWIWDNTTVAKPGSPGSLPTRCATCASSRHALA